jgi:Ni,Fe-hydrogenase III component G
MPGISDEKKLFFNPILRMEFDWQGMFNLAVGSVGEFSKKQISEGLRDMSPESIRYRFQGSKREFSEEELKYLTHLDGWNHYALGIEERENKKRGVAVIRLVRASEDKSEAEIAITIIDDYQKMGLGAFLQDLMILAALERNIKKLSYTFLPQNEGILKLLHKAGHPLLANHNRDYVHYYLDISGINVEAIKERLIKTLPRMKNFKYSP